METPETVSQLQSTPQTHATARRTTPPGQDCTPSPVSSVHRQDSVSHLNGSPGTNLTEEAVVCDTYNTAVSVHTHTLTHETSISELSAFTDEETSWMRVAEREQQGTNKGQGNIN